MRISKRCKCHDNNQKHTITSDNIIRHSTKDYVLNNIYTQKEYNYIVRSTKNKWTMTTIDKITLSICCVIVIFVISCILFNNAL